jgi:hypothetical protein
MMEELSMTMINPMTPKERQQTDKYVSELVGALNDPVIYHEGQHDHVPESFREIIRMQRLLENMAASKENREPTGTDAEAAWYMSTASLESPLNHDWTTIYQYCFTRSYMTFNGDGRNDPVLEDLRIDRLNEYQMGMLRDLKRWIYRKRCENRKGEEKEERQKQREDVKKQKKEIVEEQPNLFEF